VLDVTDNVRVTKHYVAVLKWTCAMHAGFVYIPNCKC